MMLVYTQSSIFTTNSSCKDSYYYITKTVKTKNQQSVTSNVKYKVRK